MNSLNIYLFKLINGLAGKNPYLDAFMIFSAQFLILLVPIFIVYLWLRGERKLALFIFISSLLAGMISMGIGMVYYHPRPFAMGIAKQLIYHRPDSSFPSDHTAVAFGFALPFLLFKKYRESAVFIPLATLIGVARIFCGVHFPLDILGGFAVALSVSCVLFRFREQMFNMFSRIWHSLTPRNSK